MEGNTNTEGTNNEDKIRAALDTLEKQINLCTTTKENFQSKAELTRSERIQKLIMEERRLSTEFQQIRKEIKRYEKKYERALKKKVKLMKLQIKEDHEKLNFLKQKYCKLDTQINTVIPHEIIHADKEKSKKITESRKLKTLKTTKFKRNASIKKKIRIKMKNATLNKRKMLSVEPGRQCTLTNLVNVAKPIIRNTRECKVMLQRLTCEQVNRYVTQERLAQKQQIKAKNQSQKSLENADGSVKTIRKPSWHIKIPQSVFKESQEGNENPVLSVASYIKDITQLD